MNVVDSSEQEQGLETTNLASKDKPGPNEVRLHPISDKEGTGKFLDLQGVNQHSSGSFSSCKTSSLLEHHCSKNTAKKSPPRQIVESSLFQLDDDAISSHASLNHTDTFLWRSKFANIRIGSFAAPHDDTPVVPRRSSDPYLFRATTEAELHNRDGKTCDCLNDSDATRFLSQQKTSRPSDDVRSKRKSDSKVDFQGMLLEYPNTSLDDGTESDLTKTDIEDEHSEGSLHPDRPYDDAYLHNTTRPTQASPLHAKSRRCRNQGRIDHTVQDVPITASRFRRRRSTPSDDSSRVELSGSPSTVGLSMGTGGTRMFGSSPARYCSGRGERRWSVTSGSRDDSFDEMLQTPRRSNPYDDHSPTQQGQEKGARAATTSMSKNDSNLSENPFRSPQATTCSEVVDNRAPSTSRPTPSPRDASHRIRERIQSMKCPPPL